VTSRPGSPGPPSAIVGTEGSGNVGCGVAGPTRQVQPHQCTLSTTPERRPAAPALLVIDLIRAYTEPGRPCSGSPSRRQPSRRQRLWRPRAAGHPVVRYTSGAGGRRGGRRRRHGRAPASRPRPTTTNCCWVAIFLTRPPTETGTRPADAIATSPRFPLLRSRAG
jgi:hypothetical protein